MANKTGIEQLAHSEMEKIYTDCNESFPCDSDGTRLAHFSAMKFFRLLFEFDGDHSFEYNMRKTSMGEIKRCILTRPPDFCLALNPTDISAGSSLPPKMVDHLYEECGMLNRAKDRD